MYPDVVDLRSFYARPLGRVARRLIGHQIRSIWPNVAGMNIVGFGYASPYLRPFLGEAERVLALMPAEQGVVRWPADGKGLSALALETHLPLPDECVDRLVLVHSVENSEALRALLRQVWRVLAPGGRVLIVAPNRRGFWSRRDKTPFGQGRPFSRPQLTDLLRGAMFTPTVWRACLFVPPIAARPFLRSAVAWERLGHMLGHRFAGVIMVEAAKQVYATTAVDTKADARRLAPAGASVTRRVTERAQSSNMRSIEMSSSPSVIPIREPNR